MAQSCAEFLNEKAWKDVEKGLKPDERMEVRDPTFRHQMTQRLKGMKIEDAVQEVKRAILARRQQKDVDHLTRREKGDMSEELADHFQVNVQGLPPSPYERPYHGIDMIHVAPKGQPRVYYLSEVKTDNRKTTERAFTGKQMRRGWLTQHAYRLAKSTRGTFNQGAGEEILRALKASPRAFPKNIIRLLYQVNLVTGMVKAYRMNRREEWEPFDF